MPPPITMDEVFKSPPVKQAITESDDSQRFDISYQELKDLRSQLHLAADYYEKTFAKSSQNKMVMEDTKAYICQAMVTVVDHLGTVSANLERLLENGASVSDTEFRLGCLNQRLITCQEYARLVALHRVLWIPNMPCHHKRYISPPAPSLQRCNAFMISRDSADVSHDSSPDSEFLKGEKLPSLFSVNPTLQVQKLKDNINSKFQFSTLLPVRGGPSMLSKPPSPSITTYFHKSDQRNGKSKKPVQNIGFVTLLRRSKRSSDSNEMNKLALGYRSRE